MFLWPLQVKVTLLPRLLVVGRLLCLVILIFGECPELYGGVTLHCMLLVFARPLCLVILVFAPSCLNCCYFFYLKLCLLFMRYARLVTMVSLAVKDILLKRKTLVFSYCLVISFLFGVLCLCSWKENCFMLDYFKTKLQKPDGPVCQGNLAVYYLFYVALTCKRVWHPWALDGEIRCIKPVLLPYVQCSFCIIHADVWRADWQSQWKLLTL